MSWEVMKIQVIKHDYKWHECTWQHWSCPLIGIVLCIYSPLLHLHPVISTAVRNTWLSGAERWKTAEELVHRGDLSPLANLFASMLTISTLQYLLRFSDQGNSSCKGFGAFPAGLDTSAGPSPEINATESARTNTSCVCWVFIKLNLIPPE